MRDDFIGYPSGVTTDAGRVKTDATVETIWLRASGEPDPVAPCGGAVVVPPTSVAPGTAATPGIPGVATFRRGIQRPSGAVEYVRKVSFLLPT